MDGAENLRSRRDLGTPYAVRDSGLCRRFPHRRRGRGRRKPTTLRIHSTLLDGEARRAVSRVARASGSGCGRVDKRECPSESQGLKPQLFFFPRRQASRKRACSGPELKSRQTSVATGSGESHTMGRELRTSSGSGRCSEEDTYAYKRE